jgi:hypothetical protein
MYGETNIKFNVKVLFLPVVRDFRKNIALFEGFQASPACLSDKNIINMKMNTEHWCNGIVGVKA